MDQTKIFSHVVPEHDSPPTPPSDDLELETGDVIQDYGDSFSALWVQTESHGPIPVLNYNEQTVMSAKQAKAWQPADPKMVGKLVSQPDSKIKKGDTVYLYGEKRYGVVKKFEAPDYYEIELLEADIYQPSAFAPSPSPKHLIEEEKKGEDIAQEEDPHNPNETLPNHKSVHKAEATADPINETLATEAGEKTEEIKDSPADQERCREFEKMWKEDMQEKVIKKLSKSDLAKFQDDEDKEFFMNCPKRALDRYQMPHDLEAWKQVLYLCNKEDHVFRLVNYVSTRYRSNPRYACTNCSGDHNSETEGVWRCADMACDDDYCQKCWTEKVLKEFFKLQRKHVEPTLTPEDLILMKQIKQGKKPTIRAQALALTNTIRVNILSLNAPNNLPSKATLIVASNQSVSILEKSILSAFKKDATIFYKNQVLQSDKKLYEVGLTDNATVLVAFGADGGSWSGEPIRWFRMKDSGCIYDGSVTQSRGLTYSVCFVPRVDIWFCGWGMTSNYEDYSSTHMVSFVIDGEESAEYAYKTEPGKYDVPSDRGWLYCFREFQFSRFDIAPIKIKKDSKLHIRMKYTEGEDYQKKISSGSKEEYSSNTDQDYDFDVEQSEFNDPRYSGDWENGLVPYLLYGKK